MPQELTREEFIQEIRSTYVDRDLIDGEYWYSENAMESAVHASVRLLNRVRELEEALTGTRDRLSDLPLASRTYVERYLELIGWIEDEILPAIETALPSPPTETTT